MNQVAARAPAAETHLLDAGHFALYGQPGQSATLTRGFLTRHLPVPAGH